MARAISGTAKRIGPILLVDDYDDARLTVREALENAGYSVVEAANGQQALTLLVTRHDEQVSLIILDLQMPVMDGWRLLELLRCYVGLSKIPILLKTAHDPHLEQVRHPGIFGCIRAPYQVEQLVDMVDSCLTAARSVTAESNTIKGTKRN